MSPAEVAAFDADPLRDTLLAMRHWDEAAKVPGVGGAPRKRPPGGRGAVAPPHATPSLAPVPQAQVPSLESYRGLLEALITV